MRYEYLVLHENNFFVDVFQHVHNHDNIVQMYNELIQNILENKRFSIRVILYHPTVIMFRMYSSVNMRMNL